jgi:hypothetical protein
MDRMGTQEKIGYRVEMSERRDSHGPTEFPWEREWESEFDRSGKRNYSTGMGGNGNRTVPIRR